MNNLLLQVENLHVTYKMAAGKSFTAVQGLNFTLNKGETLGIVGESGSGKSTSAMAILGLANISQGTVKILGNDVSEISKKNFRELRRHIQMVLQNPYSSLNPRMKIKKLVAEPLKIFGVPSGVSIRERSLELMQLVELHADLLERYPHQLSGGQRQRVAIARALACDPQILIADEALSALDVSIQVQILDLFRDIKSRLGLGMVFISHDLGVVRKLCDAVIVMRAGEVVESGSVDQIFQSPKHEYTKTLLRSVPTPDPNIERERRGLGKPKNFFI